MYVYVMIHNQTQTYIMGDEMTKLEALCKCGSKLYEEGGTSFCPFCEKDKLVNAFKKVIIENLTESANTILSDISHNDSMEGLKQLAYGTSGVLLHLSHRIKHIKTDPEDYKQRYEDILDLYIKLLRKGIFGAPIKTNGGA